MQDTSDIIQNHVHSRMEELGYALMEYKFLMDP